MENAQASAPEQGSRLDLAAFIAHTAAALKDEFVATVESDDSGLTVCFVDGQTFRLTAAEIG